jgi:sigma-B regulation protein RsbU (phosphoserine phosphatase)
VQEILNACLSRGKDHPQQMVQALSEAAHDFVGDAPQSDDLALLVVKYEPGDLVREQLILSNMEGEVARLGTFVKAFCDRLPLDSKTASGLRLALEESVVNVINYAYPAGETGEVRIYAESNRKEVRFTIVDSGTPFDPTAVLSADITLDVQNRPIGGLGIHLTRKLMDSVSYCRKHGKNVLTLTKNIS